MDDDREAKEDRSIEKETCSKEKEEKKEEEMRMRVFKYFK